MPIHGVSFRAANHSMPLSQTCKPCTASQPMQAISRARIVNNLAQSFKQTDLTAAVKRYPVLWDTRLNDCKSANKKPVTR